MKYKCSWRTALRQSLASTVSILAMSGTALPVLADEQSDAPAQSLDEVVVTGSYLHLKQEDRASPVLVVNQDELNKLGVQSLGDMTKFIPQNVGSTGGMQDLAKGGFDTHDTRSANLRGLGAGATLVLLNGRREVPLDGYVNLNALTPDIAIQQVETVLDGASATYGADAVAGVINVITNTHFQGMEASAQYTHIANSPAAQVQGMWGGGGERFHIVTAASYTYTDNLQNADRSVTNFYNPSSGTGANPGNFTLTSRPHTASGGDVIIGGNDYSTLYDKYKSGTGSLTVVDPACGSAATKSRYTPAANGPGWGLGSCSFSFQAQNPIRPESRSLVFHTDANYDLDADRSIFLESGIYHQDSNRFGVPSYAQNHNGATGPIVPASNPYNPFGVDVAFTGRAIGSDCTAGLCTNKQTDRVDQYQTVLGSQGLLVGDWSYLTDLTWSRGVLTHEDHDTNGNLFQNALNGYGGANCNIRYNGPGVGAVPGQGNCYYFSPFAKDDATNNPATAFNIQSNEFFTYMMNYLTTDLVVNGSPGEVFGRKLDVAIGGQIRYENQARTYSDLYQSGFGGFNGPSHDTSGNRVVKSIFGELNYPIFPTLNVDVAARHEDYGQFTTTDPKIAVNWRVVPELALRASASTAFQAPSLDNASAGQISSGVTNITDPATGGTTFRTVVTTGNPSLKPQTSTVFNLGFTALPVERSSLSLDYWHYQYDNQIETQNAQAVINANPFGPQVIRDQNGLAQTVIVTTFNAPSGTQTSGLDLAAMYGLDIGPVKVNWRDNLSLLLTYDIDTGTTVYDGVGRRNNATTSPASSAAAPRWRNLMSLSGDFESHSLNVDMRYISSVIDDYNIPLTASTNARVKASTLFDMQYSYHFGRDDRYRIDVGMINIFDRSPPTAIYTGYLSSLEDPYGRQTYVKLDARF